MRIKYRPAAIEDIRKASDYIAFVLKNPTAAASLRSKIVNGISLLKENPNMGALLSNKFDSIDSDYRYIVISKQIVFYELDNDLIEIVRVLDGRTDYLSRLIE